VELLISVTILAIIVIPLMHVFLTSSKINIKSRKTLRATTVAQDIMEGLKAYDIDELKDQFNNPAEGFYVINDSIVKGGVGEDETREAAEVSTDADGNPNPGYYCFTMEGVTLQGSEYDALIKIDGRDYMESGAHTANQNNTDATGTPKAHNNGGFAAVSAIMEDEDGVYAEKSSFTETVLDMIRSDSDFQDAFSAAGVNPADVTFGLAGMTVSRYYTVDITDGGTDAEGNKIADVMITVEYQCSYNGVPSDGHPRTFYGVDHVPYASFTSGNFYFLYYPLYEASEEIITVNNTANIPLNLTIAKQVYSSEDPTDPYVLSDAKLDAAEKNYQVIVDMYGGSLDQTKIRTNLGTNLTNSTYLTGEGETTDVPGQVKFKYNGAVTTSMNVFTLSGVRNTALGAAGADDEITEVIYDVTVEVYEAGAADKDFPEEDRMVSIDGSKNN
jgi:hypothetical protein